MSKKVKKAKLDGFVVIMTREYPDSNENYTDTYLVKAKTEKDARRIAMEAQDEAQDDADENGEDFYEAFEHALIKSGVEVQYIQPAYVGTSEL
jgi:putative ribosome biogenesis GTPase RsgA